ncbi:hypothetical protein BGW36DRAFT_13507 [Talaromyces proteolyticus]|uniref:Uncharacterized protein n=1 Tax=Talaromyces proteolyticus TaxID=1131652 RepID=A0AAD4L2J3_9EURO|nr:uncharacterized protein BGW36DRAFT_13507 [Talaromyces proteolyticus]KAH8705441.1 hypothetical protein BGW36DRAFT_13507 [Talaromyces proteolyticus]
MTSETKANTSLTQPHPHKVARGNATIAMGVMSLIASILTGFLGSPVWTEPSTPTFNSKGQPEDPVIVIRALVVFFSGILWIAGLFAWVENLNKISAVLRNNSLIGGLAAANIGIVYTMLMSFPATSFRHYVIYTLWPTHVGLVIGALI